MTLGEMIFLLMIFITMAGAALAILSGDLIHAILGLITAMFGIAGLYVYLNSPFLAMMQILIYVGAISVLIAFAVMLAGPMYLGPKEWTTLTRFAAATGVAFVSLVVLFRFVKEAFPRVVPAFDLGPKDIGQVFLGRLILPFELISVLIVIGILGAIMLAIFSRGNK